MRTKVQRIAKECVRDLAARILNTAVNANIEEVHNLRVAVRKTAQALRLVDDYLPDGAARRLSHKIRKVRERAAAVRDRDVILALLELHKLPADDPAYASLRMEREMAANQLRKYLAELNAQEKPKRWLKLLRKAC